MLVAIVGMKHRGTEEFLKSLPQGEPLRVVREPDNRFDPRAVQVWARGQCVGTSARPAVWVKIFPLNWRRTAGPWRRWRLRLAR